MTQNTNQPDNTAPDPVIGSTATPPSEKTSHVDFPGRDATEIEVEPGQHNPVPVHHLDRAEPLDPSKFPNQGTGDNGKLPATIPNLMHLLAGYSINVRYNVICKKLETLIPGASGCPDNADNSALAQIISLATLNNIPIGQVTGYLEAIGDRNQYNPVADWITGELWDGVDRLQELYDTLDVREGFPKTLRDLLLHRWLLSAVAAALKSGGFRARGVLTLQGPQSIGKTAWISALIPDSLLSDSVIKLDHHLDAGNKDSQITAICHWIVEVGELDSSFRKDIARLKGFITSDRDKVRRPYRLRPASAKPSDWSDMLCLIVKLLLGYIEKQTVHTSTFFLFSFASSV